MVVAQGSLRGLSNKQHYALVAGVTDWIGAHFSGYRPRSVAFGDSPPPPDCSECSNELPWSEVYFANNGRCSWCEQVHHKDKD